MNDRWSERLSEYLDGELPAEETRALEEHLASCAGCRAELDSLRAVVSRLEAAPDREPPADLWPGLHEAIEASSSPHPAGWLGWRAALPLAAAMFLLAVFWWPAGNKQGPDDDDPYAEAASAWEDHLAARDLPPEVADVLQAEIAVLDRAITETRRALERAPGDADLRAHLAATLRAKVRFLARIEEFTGESS